MPSLFPTRDARLPQTQSLLICGPFHPSAPIHYVLSAISEDKRDRDALFITSSRERMATAMKEYRDSWIEENGTHGRVGMDAARVRMFFPPTPTHFSLLNACLEIAKPSPGERKLQGKTTLDSPPLVVVLHELSAYFMNADPQTNTVSAFLALVTSAMSAIAQMAPDDTIPVVLFDSHLDALKTPITKPAAFGGESTTTYLDAVPLIEKFFHARAIVRQEGCNFYIRVVENQAPSAEYVWQEHRDERGRVSFGWP
ncbi:hypothetical protein CYLTODRAFT_240799 [Cylindrobasidium torrendii FP15055 ss-10]|uniref:Uncharacterized protein n=1 Tax=Cylindrobasidium torrendii FP15055 ss-10 TaxID=1314674 RepID=A0A0D7BSP6_9AGAR|nr:hypothetical protein CYLTODRAFT_240799 [Cylindrobasidium torrendii FP15055 ss-10]